MRKRILILFLFISFMYLCGCENEKCIVTFLMDSEQQMIQINKGSILNYNLVSLFEGDEIEGLYYDDNFKNEYDNKKIENDIIVHVKIKKVNVTFIFLNNKMEIQVNKNRSIKINDIAKYIEPYSIQGLYYDPLFTLKYNGELLTDNTTIYLDLNMNDMVRVGNIYTLEEAYEQNFIKIEDIYQIKNNIDVYCYGETLQNIYNGVFPCDWISDDLISQIFFDKEKQLNPDCSGCLELDQIKKYFIYFGTYNDCIIFRSEGCGLYIGTDWGINIYIEDTMIHLPEGPNVYVWKPIGNIN